MAVRDILAAVPWWVKWVVVPVIVLCVFGGLVVSIVSFVIGLLFKVLLIVAVIGVLLFVVRKFIFGRSHSDW